MSDDTGATRPKKILIDASLRPSLVRTRDDGLPAVIRYGGTVSGVDVELDRRGLDQSSAVARRAQESAEAGRRQAAEREAERGRAREDAERQAAEAVAEEHRRRRRARDAVRRAERRAEADRAAADAERVREEAERLAEEEAEARRRRRRERDAVRRAERRAQVERAAAETAWLAEEAERLAEEVKAEERRRRRRERDAARRAEKRAADAARRATDPDGSEREPAAASTDLAQPPPAATVSTHGDADDGHRVTNPEIEHPPYRPAREGERFAAGFAARPSSPTRWQRVKSWFMSH